VRGALFGRINARAFAMECVAANIFSMRCDEWRARPRRWPTSYLGAVFDIIWVCVRHYIDMCIHGAMVYVICKRFLES